MQFVWPNLGLAVGADGDVVERRGWFDRAKIGAAAGSPVAVSALARGCR